MLPEIESIDNPKTTHTGLEEPSRKRDAPSDDMLQNSLTTGITTTSIRLFCILIYSLFRIATMIQIK